jgi:signal transduction histidine kinase
MPTVAPPGLTLPQLLAALAHDLKNPLAALTTNLHFLADAPTESEAERAEALDDSLVVSEQLDLLLRNLELFSRGDAPSSRSAPIVLSAIVDDALRRTERIARAAEVTIERVPTASPGRAVADADLLVRALENCLLNAIEHAPRAGVVRIEIVAKGPRIVVQALRVRAWSLFDGLDPAGQRPQTIYGRGLSLHCADLAARAAGAHLEIARAEDAEASRFELIAPAPR